MTLPDWVLPFDEWTLRGRWWPVTRRPTGTPNEANVIHHSVTNTAGKDAVTQIRDIEEIIYQRRITSKFSMVAYSFLISSDAQVFEGRGLTYRNGANNDTKNTGFGNANTFSICFAGNYMTDEPTDAQLDAAGRLVRWLKDHGHAFQTAPTIPHSQVHATACCGTNLRQKLHIIDAYTDEESEMQVPISLGYDSGDKTWRVFVAGEGSFITTDYQHWRDAIQTAHDSGYALSSPHLNEAVARCRAEKTQLPQAAPISTKDIAAIATATVKLHGTKLT